MNDYLKPIAEMVDFGKLNPNVVGGEGGSESNEFNEGDFG